MLKNRKNIQEQTKPYLQNKQLILACGSRARQRLPDDGQKCDMESQVGHIAINRPNKAHQSLIYYARAHTRTVGENDKKYGRFKVATKYKRQAEK